MNNPLRYQMTEYDCGPTSMLNAVSYLFRRDEIPPERFIRTKIWRSESCRQKEKSVLSRAVDPHRICCDRRHSGHRSGGKGVRPVPHRLDLAEPAVCPAGSADLLLHCQLHRKHCGYEARGKAAGAYHRHLCGHGGHRPDLYVHRDRDFRR